MGIQDKCGLTNLRCGESPHRAPVAIAAPGGRVAELDSLTTIARGLDARTQLAREPLHLLFSAQVAS